MREKLIDYIQEELVEEQLDLTDDEDLLSSGLLDSLSVMRLISFMEKEFEVKVLPQEMTVDNFITVEAICNYLSNKKV